MSPDFQTLLQQAKEVSKNAYAPYSKFLVGACAVFESGKTYTGCNVENASYGLSLCAERNTLSTAIAQGEKSKLIAIAIYSPNMPACVPCGACRQWLNEFAPDAQVILETANGEVQTYLVKELLPYAFNL